MLPEVVNQGRDGYYTVDYAKLTPLLVEAVKELQSINRELLDRLESLEELIYSSRTIENSN